MFALTASEQGGVDSHNVFDGGQTEAVPPRVLPEYRRTAWRQMQIIFVGG
jgi:hypothetical protein